MTTLETTLIVIMAIWVIIMLRIVVEAMIVIDDIKKQLRFKKDNEEVLLNNIAELSKEISKKNHELHDAEVIISSLKRKNQ